MALGSIRSSTSFSSEFSRGQLAPHSHPSSSLHANDPRDNSVEHSILIRVLLTRKWPQGQFGRVASFNLSYPYTRRGRKERKHEKNLSVERKQSQALQCMIP